jgi:hypothetical protein
MAAASRGWFAARRRGSSHAFSWPAENRGHQFKPPIQPVVASLMNRRHVAILLASLVALAPATASAQQYSLVANERTNVRDYQRQPGRHLSFICPADVGWKADIWGTDIYTDTSPVCAAAIHAGRFKPGRASLVTILLIGPAQSFSASTRNDVTSLEYGPWEGSYTFSNDGEPGQVDWQTTAQHIPAEFVDPITVVCPSKGDTTAPIWGTDVYTDTSAICVAAVHAGIISAAVGGRVAIQLVAQIATYAASERNGISSIQWNTVDARERPNPFTVVPGAINARSPVAATTVSGQGRTIELAGFAASGTAVAIRPRTITLSGFTASGEGIAIRPRSISVPGWAGVGAADDQ